MTASSRRRRRLRPRNRTQPTVTPTSTSCTPCSLPTLWRVVSLCRADATKEQTLGADSTAYVEVPLDIMLQYFHRAKRAVAGLPVGKRLAWLQAHDSDERSEWVTKFREGTRSLGAVVKELMVSRDAHWLPRVVSDNESVAAPVATPHPAVAAPKPAPEAKFLPGPVI